MMHTANPFNPINYSTLSCIWTFPMSTMLIAHPIDYHIDLSLPDDPVAIFKSLDIHLLAVIEDDLQDLADVQSLDLVDRHHLHYQLLQPP